MSNDLVARLRWYVTNVSSINSPLVPALQKIIAEAADALSQTIPRTTDEGIREILAEECKTAGAWMAAADLRNNHSCDVPHNAALAAMRRVSKTDEGRNAVWQPIETAPKDGTRVLLLLKDPIPEARDDLRRWDGIPFVGCNHGNISEWQFAAPVGHGGFPDEWMVGWQPISPTHNR